MSHLQYNCDSCGLSILPTNPRVHCLVCADYDLCANCALGERFTQGHLGGHQTSIFKQCGGGGQNPMPAAINYAAAPAPPQSPPGFSQPPPPVYQSHPQAPPPPVPARQPNSPSYGPGPTSPPPPANAMTGWQPFFYPDSAPTPLFVQLMNDIFSYLDPRNTGNLVPETFSRLLDDMGYQTHENACKSINANLIITFTDIPNRPLVRFIRETRTPGELQRVQGIQRR